MILTLHLWVFLPEENYPFITYTSYSRSTHIVKKKYVKLGEIKKKHLFGWWIPKNREVLKVSLILHLPLTGDNSPNSTANWNPSRVPCSQGAERSKESFQERWANWHLWNSDAEKKKITQQENAGVPSESLKESVVP